MIRVDTERMGGLLVSVRQRAGQWAAQVEEIYEFFNADLTYNRRITWYQGW